MTDSPVSWSDYAQKYDMLLQYNPFYQSLVKEVMDKAATWQVQAGDILLDLGAGTGNYSCALAERFPEARILHVDNDAGMNRVATAKKERQQLPNLEIREADMRSLVLEPNSVQGITCIHALYTQDNPPQILQNLHHWLAPEGRAILVDPGRIVQVLSWQIAIGSHLIRQYGLRKTLQILREGKEVSKQNQAIRKLQEEGVYWTHSHAEFCQAVETAGFTIIDAGTTFRGISDWVVVRK